MPLKLHPCREVHTKKASTLLSRDTSTHFMTPQKAAKPPVTWDGHFRAVPGNKHYGFNLQQDFPNVSLYAISEFMRHEQFPPARGEGFHIL